jgi:fructoselysine-6-P-deglycase FrlB-like protein
LRLDNGVDVRLSGPTKLTVHNPMAATLAAARGHDPDRPRGLKKVTSTV